MSALLLQEKKKSLQQKYKNQLENPLKKSTRSQERARVKIKFNYKLEETSHARHSQQLAA